MGKISDQIKSIRQTVGRDYVKPDALKMAGFVSDLGDSQEALDYLHKERVLTDDTIEHFKLGYDKERDAIAIPVYKDNVLIDIKYRFLKPDKNKYSREKGSETWLYNEAGIEEGKSKGGVLVVEGEFDLMSVWQSGIKNVVSPSSGKESYGVWLELLDNIPRVYVAFDNDKPGQEASYKFAERVGMEKSFEVKYPSGIKDANDFFKIKDKDDLVTLIKRAQPFYTHQFKGVGDIITSLRENKEVGLELDLLPKVKLEKDWLVVLSGRSNVGKTSYCMNVIEELAQKDVPTLVMPFERGIDSVGKRYLQVKFDKGMDEFQFVTDDEWEKMIDDCIENPVYFSVPKKEDIVDTIIKSKRLFDTKVVIIDHLDYVVRHVSGNREAEIANTLQNLKRVAEENGIIIVIVTHIRKIDDVGSAVARKPRIEDLKGSSSLYQDPEVVALLTSENQGELEVIIAKNKGAMGSGHFIFNERTGKLSIDDF